MEWKNIAAHSQPYSLANRPSTPCPLVYFNYVQAIDNEGSVNGINSPLIFYSPVGAWHPKTERILVFYIVVRRSS